MRFLPVESLLGTITWVDEGPVGLAPPGSAKAEPLRGQPLFSQSVDVALSWPKNGSRPHRNKQDGHNPFGASIGIKILHVGHLWTEFMDLSIWPKSA